MPPNPNKRRKEEKSTSNESSTSTESSTSDKENKIIQKQPQKVEIKPPTPKTPSPKKPATEGEDPAPKPRRSPNGYLLPDKLPENLVVKDQRNFRWKIGKCVGTGGFGEIYSAALLDGELRLFLNFSNHLNFTSN